MFFDLIRVICVSRDGAVGSSRGSYPRGRMFKSCSRNNGLGIPVEKPLQFMNYDVLCEGPCTRRLGSVPCIVNGQGTATGS